MKRLALLIVALAACALFTACPDNKPEETNYVIIPDGTYEETAYMLQYLIDTKTNTSLNWWDTTLSAIVAIEDGYFKYCDMCADTIHYNPHFSDRFVYASHFVYYEEAYCFDLQPVRYPVRANVNSSVRVNYPIFSYASFVKPDDSTYSRIFSVHKEGDTYQFEQKHSFTFDADKRFFIETQHTLKPLSNQ